MRTSLCLLALAACTPQVDVTRPEDAPTGAILVPGEGTTVPSGPVELRGQVADTETDPDHLFVVWSLGNDASDADGSWRDVCDGFADAQGGSLCTARIAVGDTRVRMVVTDLAGFRHQEIVDVIVDPVEAPQVTLSTPDGGHWLYADVPFRLVATVSDVDDPVTGLVATWTDNLVGVVAGPAQADEAGSLQGAVTLPAGDHRLTVTVTDPGGASGTDSVLLEVIENHAPTARIEAPVGSAVVPGTPLPLVGRALDPDVDPDELTFAWASDLDGPLGDGVPAAGGVARVDDVVLSAGVHVLTLTVTDDAGATAEATVTVPVGLPPEVTWTSPAQGGVDDVYAGLILDGLATDDRTPPTDLTVRVRSDVDGVILDGAHPDAQGRIGGRILGLHPGAHELTLTVTDADGLATETRRSITIVIP